MRGLKCFHAVRVYQSLMKVDSFKFALFFCANQEWQDWQNWQFQQNRQDAASEKKGMEWIKMQDLKS